MRSRRSVYSSNRMLETERRLAINTIVLPPLPPLEESEIQILHKVLVNKSKQGGVSGELVAVGKAAEISTRSADVPKSSDGMRAAQLEQNIRFLQDQHTQMLAGLHKEIDNLRHRNRELQFQLVFAKGAIPSSPSSPEDDTKAKIYLSPKQVNVTPLQVEILEKELGELKIQLQDIDSRNAYLSAIVEEQKKKLDRYERDREREMERATQPDPELLRKLDDAESLIRRLRRENSELRLENSTASASSSNNTGGGSYHQGHRGGGTQNRSNNGRHRGNSAGHYRGNWFPPLHAQTYWHGGRGVERNGGSGGSDSTTLPSLLPNNSGSNSNGQYQGRRGSNNNHYHNGEGKRYKNGLNRGANKPS